MTVRDIIAEPLEVMGLTSSRDETDERVREIAAKCRIILDHLGLEHDVVCHRWQELADDPETNNTTE